MTLVGALIIALTFVLVTVALSVLSAADAAVRLVARSRTRRLIESGREGAVAFDALVERPSRLAAALAFARACGYAGATATVVWSLLAAEVGPSTSGLLAAVAGIGVVVAVFSLAEALPRTLAVHNPERVGLASAPVAARLTAALSPVARALGAVWRRIAALVVEEPVTDVWVTGEEQRFEPGEDEEAAGEDTQEAFIEAVADFASKIVREVMVPRTDMRCVEESATVPDAVALVKETGFSRLPVFRETLDDIVGVLYAKDLLGCMGAGSCPATVGPIAREAYFVPETKPVDELLFDMRQRKTHIALVADEYGGTAGLVTIEDLLEEIVGEIFDEYDRAEPMVEQLEDGRMVLDARLPIDDFNDLFGTALELEADSIGGLFVELAGHIPQPGESIEVEGVHITARDVEGTRVRRVVVEPKAREKEGQDAEAHH